MGDSEDESLGFSEGELERFLAMHDPLRYKIIRKRMPAQHGLRGMARIEVLARHKPRIIWHTMDIIRDTLKEPVSRRYRVHKRTKRLAKPRELHKDYKPPRPPGPEISKAALKASASSRTRKLAQPRKLPKDWSAPRIQYWVVNRAALTFRASSRLAGLALPIKLPGLAAPSYLNLLAIPRRKKRAPHPKYTDKLAKPKGYDEDYVPDRIGLRPINMKKLLEYQTPARFNEICKPLKVYPRHSREWVVSKAALHYKITPRLDELALPRKIIDPFVSEGVEEIVVET